MRRDSVIADLKEMGIDVDLLIIESDPTDRALEQLREGFQRMLAKHSVANLS